MPQYSPVAPVHLLEQLHRKGRLGNYLLLLAHEVLEAPDAYSDLLWDVRETYGSHDTTIILDNGVIERGSAIDIGALLEAASIVNPTCVAAPDVLGDYAATCKLAAEQVPLIQEEYSVLFIPQGATLPLLENCIDWYTANFCLDPKKYSYWGVPRWIANKLNSRAHTVSYIGYGSYPCKIHLLGMSNHMRDDFLCLKMPYVRGIDSANPLVLGANEIRMHSFMMYQHLDRGDFWQMPKLTEDMLYNVEWMHNELEQL